MSKSLREVRDGCRRKATALLESPRKCHLDPGHRSDGCGYYQGKYAYLSVDCRTVKGKPLCWVSIIDHYSGELLYSEACPTTPEAADHGRAFFTTDGRKS